MSADEKTKREKNKKEMLENHWKENPNRGYKRMTGRVQGQADTNGASTSPFILLLPQQDLVPEAPEAGSDELMASHTQLSLKFNVSQKKCYNLLLGYLTQSCQGHLLS